MDALDIAASQNQYYTGGQTIDLTVPGALVPISNPVPYVEPDQSARSNAVFSGVAGILNSLANVYSAVKYSPRPTGPYPGAAPGASPYYPPNYASVGYSGQATLTSLMPILLIGAGAFILIRLTGRR